MSASFTLQPVVMAGGSGTRLWPLSRAGYPKQFLVLAGNSSLLQQAALRLQGLEADGALRLRLDDGAAHVIHAGDVTLDAKEV